LDSIGGSLIMNLVYTPHGLPPAIEVTLADGEQLGNHTGPIVMFVPTDPANAEYAEILAKGLVIEPPPVS
jgi:hypothetical protein